MSLSIALKELSAPAAYENTISVGATEYGGGNYGSITNLSLKEMMTLIDVFAPGGAITACKKWWWYCGPEWN